MTDCASYPSQPTLSTATYHTVHQWRNRSRCGTCTCRRQLCSKYWQHDGFRGAGAGRYCTTHLKKAEGHSTTLEGSVWIIATIWALMATINPVCERGPDCRRRADSLTSSGWSVAGVIYAGVTVSCLPTCQNGPAKWAARPTRRVVDA